MYLVNLVAAWRIAMPTLFGLDCVRALVRGLLILPSVALLLQPLFAQAGSNAAVATPSEVLELEDNTFTAMGSRALADIVEGWEGLSELGLNDCYLTARGWAMVGESLRKGKNARLEILKA